jgi:ABC-type iron transport system FetAB ATPase subunit
METPGYTLCKYTISPRRAYVILRFMSRLSLIDIAVLDLQPVNIAVAEADCVCLTGPSGAGKSLLLRAVADLIPHLGDASLDDSLCSTMKPSLWRRQVGYLPSESHWWSDRVGDHFSQPHAMAFQQLGFDTDVLNWEVSRLSTGEKQRLALLRLLTNQPRALLLDEPTASLDAQGVTRVETMLGNYQQQHQVPLLWVSHDAEQVERVAHRVFELQQGQVREVA